MHWILSWKGKLHKDRFDSGFETAMVTIKMSIKTHDVPVFTGILACNRKISLGSNQDHTCNNKE